jgi:hypothetical protein
MKYFTLLFIVASFCSMAYTSVYSTKIFSSRLSEQTNEVIELIKSNPEHRNEYIYMSEASLKVISPFVTFKSFVAKREGRYYHQDPITAQTMYKDFLAIKNKEPGWYDVLIRKKIKWFIFNLSDDNDLKILKSYRENGRVVMSNDKWMVLNVLKSDESS